MLGARLLGKPLPAAITVSGSNLTVRASEQHGAYWRCVALQFQLVCMIKRTCTA